MKRGASQSGRSPGQPLLRLAWQSTLALAVVATFGLMAPESSGPFVVTACLTMFVLGLLLFVFGLMYGLRRSRVEAVTVAGLFLLQNSAPRSIRRQFAWLTITQLVVALTAAALRPYTDIAFVILAPMLPVGSAALWSAQHGFFPERGCDHA
ncbi:MAG: hypothetical protein Ct9H300mP26_4770 [Acidimicrobiales bacterium]|jgi:hypothetical protein|nr:MAG: hypothetical protein Ct9H300mP26_4770 [Acidimicrobiales bacterium]